MVDPNSIKIEIGMTEPTEWEESTFGSERPPRFIKINEDCYMQVKNIEQVFTGSMIEVWYPEKKTVPESYYKALTRWIPTSMYYQIMSEEAIQNQNNSDETGKEISQKMDAIMLAIADLYESIERKE